jgi:ribosome-associated protein
MNSKPSKSAKKREAQNVQALAGQLLKLSAEQLAGMPLDDELREVVIATRNTTARSALRRQRLYLAKVLRDTDTTALCAAIAALEHEQNHARRVFHQAERWRDRILRDGKPAVAEFSALLGTEKPELDRLASELQQELPQTQQRRLGREVFRLVHDDLTHSVHKAGH